MTELRQPGGHFSQDKIDEEFNESGEFDLSFSQYGETFGKTVDTPIDEFEKEKGVIRREIDMGRDVAWIDDGQKRRCIDDDHIKNLSRVVQKPHEGL